MLETEEVLAALLCMDDISTTVYDSFFPYLSPPFVLRCVHGWMGVRKKKQYILKDLVLSCAAAGLQQQQ